MADAATSWRDRARDIAEGIILLAGAAWVITQPFLARAATRVRDAARALWHGYLSLDSGGRRRVIGSVALVAALLYAWSWHEVPGHWLAHLNGERPLYAAKSWHYQLDKVDLDKLAKTDADVIVTDFAKMGGKVALSPDEVARIRTGPDGRRRVVLAYMSVGEAEEFRFYFKPDWKADAPEWLGPENCAWPGAHKVKFWHDSWKDTIWRGRNAYLKQIIDAGFDGVYLDRVDIYDQYPDRPSARRDMIDFVIDLSAQAKSLKPGFFIVPQNADDLLQEFEYRDAIDGLGREDLLHGVGATGMRNSADDIRAAQRRLELLGWEWKPVFAVEYLKDPAQIATVRKELLARGLVPTFQPRALDGTDPSAPIDLKTDAGTSEYTKANCEPGKSW